MPTNLNYYEYAKLATASYVRLESLGVLGDRVAFGADDQARLPLALANQTFDSGSAEGSGRSVWGVAQSSSGTGYFGNDGTGFAATLFERTGQNGQGVEKVLAIRGTEPRGDFLKDLLIADVMQIGFVGFALSQTVSMMNLMLRLRAPANTPVGQLKWNLSGTTPAGIPNIPIRGGSAYLYLSANSSANGLGLLSDTDRIVVTGHSLGGHVSAMAARLFPTVVSEAYAYNTPGFDPEYSGAILGLGTAGIVGLLSRNPAFAAVAGLLTGIVSTPLKLTEQFVNALAAPWLLEPPAPSFASLNVHVVEGEDLAPGDDLSIVSSVISNQQALGAETFITTEGNSHLIEPLMDNLALHALLTSMNGTLTGAQITRLYEVISDKTSTAQEKLVEGLYKAIKGESVTLSPVVDVTAGLAGISGIGAGDIVGRRDYYVKVVEIEKLVKASPALHLESVADRALTVDEAKQNIAVRYALKELNPFVVSGVDYQGLHNANGELDLYDPSTDKGTLTDKWLEARAELLATKLAYNLSDGAIGGVLQGRHFEDKASDYALGIPFVNKHIVFGSGNVDTVTGSPSDDKLFGGAGGDTISGGSGDDYIEGNDGFDTIDAGFGDDEVYGGEGNDTISGFTGVDKLYGGAGGDTFDGGLGNDIIYGDRKDDPDSTEITGDDTIDGGWGEDKIWGGWGKDTIHGGRDDDKIEGNAGDDTLYGDEGVDTIKGGAGIDTIYGGAGRDTIEGGVDGDIIYGGESAADTATFGNTLTGDAGDDKLYGDGGVDAIDGGTGKDLIVGNFGKDMLTGGSEDDEIYGDLKAVDSPVGDDDQLDGGDGNDVLEGGAGRDVLMGGEGADKLRGGKGVADYMVGGTGDDTYFYRADDGADLVFDEDQGAGGGRILYEGQQLNGGANRTKGALTWYDGDPCDPDFTFSASSDPNLGPVTLTITSKAGGLLRVFDFDNGELGINLSDGNDPSCGKRPPTPARSGPPTRGDPLVLDLGSIGIATYGLSANLYFDMDGDGFAEKTGWAGAGEGVLVYDRNLDGILNDGQELFGDFTRLNGGQLATGGFQALSAYDANHDGLIDAQDPVWSSLRVGVWETDPFGQLILGDPRDAVSLKGLDSFGITSISVASTIVSSGAIDPTVNVQTRTGTYTLEGGATRQVAEFRLARDNAETKFLQNLPVPEANSTDPGLPMGGQVMNLQQALIRDDAGEYLGKPAGALRAKLDAFTNEADPSQWFARFEELLFAWTGADAIPAGTKTGLFDARHAAVLEKTYGQSFQNPNYDQWAGWQTAYERLAEAMYSGLLAQTHLKDKYDAIDWADNAVTQSLFGNLSAVQSMLDGELAADPARGRAFVNEFARSLRGLGHTQDTSYLALREHFTEGGTDPSLGFAFDATGKPAPYKPGTYTGWGTVYTGLTEAVHSTTPLSPYGLTGDDVFYVEGPAGSNSHLVGTTGANVLVATGGNDLLWAHEGDDLLDGGAGDDTLKGLAGNDVYVFRRGSGRDTIQELDGIDTVFLGSGLRREDLLLRRTPDGGFELQIAGTEDVLVIPAPQSWVPSPHGGSLGAAEQSTSTVERFMFDDGTLMRLQDFVTPTEGDDDFAPLEDPFDDVFDLLGGNDRADGRRGDDTLSGGAGDDTLIGGPGNDVLEGGTGDDLLLATSDQEYFLGYYRYFGFGVTGATNGNDEVRFGFGDGSDTLIDLDSAPGNLDTIALGAGVTPADVTLVAEGDDMVVQLSSGDRLTVKSQYLDNGVSIERLAFADGTVWSGDTLSTVTRIGTPGDDLLTGAVRHRNHLIGAGGDDELRGALAADALEGGDGDDALYGGEGADLYDGGADDDLLQEPVSSASRSVGADVFLFGRGDGNDTLVTRKIVSGWFTTTPAVDDDVVRFKAGVSPDDLVIEGANASSGAASFSTDIVMRIAGDPDSSLRIEGFLDGRESGYLYLSTVRRFEFDDGTAWDYDQIADRVQWIGTDGADTLRAGRRNETLLGLAGDDRLFGLQGDDALDGGAGDDVLYGDSGNDTLLGGDGDDRLETGVGNDTADGGAGDDLIGITAAGVQFDAPQLYNLGGWATPGDLTVLFGRGDGRDTVQVANARADSNDTLRLKPGVAPEDIALARVKDDLVLSIADTEDSVTVRDWFTPKYTATGRTDPFRVENVAFDDGTVLDAEAIRARVLLGGEGDDTLRGYDDRDDLVLGNGGDDRLAGGDGADRLAGGAGGDWLDGGAGDDLYAFDRGDGNDTIVSAGGDDAIEFGAGIAPEDVLVRNRGGDLVLALDSGETIRVPAQFLYADSAPVAEVRFYDGTAWDAQMLRALALQGTAGDDYLEGFDWGDDTLAGGAGNDALEGGFGDDLYLFGAGDGYDFVSDRGGYDALSFGELLPDAVEFSLEGHALIARIAATGDAVEIGEFYSGATLNDTVEEFRFDGGAFALSAAEVLALTGSDADEVLFGTPDDDVLEGGAQRTLALAGDGNDLVLGGGGMDELHGGGGDDELAGEDDDDTLLGEDGDDTLYGDDGLDILSGDAGADALFGGDGNDELAGGDGDDTLEGGAGDDLIEGGAGADTIRLAPGDGLDDMLADPFSGGDVAVREGFEPAYDEARSELSTLGGYAADEIFSTGIWNAESDGGFASGIAPDLLDRLFTLYGGVPASEAREILADLEVWLTTPLRQGTEWSYDEMEFAARAAFADAREAGEETYANDYWSGLSWNYEIPADIFDPLVQMGEDGLPAREAQVALQQLLGWLYDIVGSGEDSSRFWFFRLYGEALVQIEEARARLGAFDTYSSGYWLESSGADGLVDLLPENLRDRLVGFDGDVPLDDAIATLEELRDYLLQRESGAGESDTVEFGPGVTADDLEIAVADGDSGGYGGGAGGIVELAIGIRGTNDGLTISENGHGSSNFTPVADLSVRRLRFDDGTELTLQDLLDRADGRIGEQTGNDGSDDLRGSAARDVIFASGGDDTVRARGGDDEIHGQAGDDAIGAGAGDDQADGGPGDDLIAGERGDDAMRGGPGDDTFAFNYGDGHDLIDAFAGGGGDVDTISFGAGIAPEMVTATMSAGGRLRLWVNGGEGGSLDMAWLNEGDRSPIDPPAVRRVQFVDAGGAVRVFDLAALVASRGTELSGANPDRFVALFGGGEFELTGTVAPAGGGRAVAYAQTGDLFAEPFYAGGNAAGDGDDVLIGSDFSDAIDGGDGDDVIAAGAGDDVLTGGGGDDRLVGGGGADQLFAGPGDDSAAGGDGDDTYYFSNGDGVLAIDDEAFDRGPNRLVFSGVNADALRLGYEGGFLVLTTGVGGDAVRLSNFDFAAVHDARAVDVYEFGDGSTLGYDELVDRGFYLAGTPGVDVLQGTDVDDTLDGLGGDDFLQGGYGDDALEGGAGGDTYFFRLFDGADTLIDRESDAERNLVQFDAGIDPSSVYAVLDAGDLYLYYGGFGDAIRVPGVRPGDDASSAPFERMLFADGTGLALSGLLAGGLPIYGTPEDDELAGAQGDDAFFGFEGADLLSGGAGDDFYYVTEGGGLDTIVDSAEGGQFNTVVFDHAGAQSAGDLAASFDRDAGTLIVRVRGTGDGVALTGFDADNPSAHPAADLFVLQNGSEVAYDELVARGFELEGTAGADVLLGSAAHDLIRGLAGNDVIAGGAGSDVAEGGAGNDLYVFKRGDGLLTIRDEISRDAQNILAFGPGIALADLRNNLRFAAPDPSTGAPGVLRIGLGGGEEVRIEGFDPDEPETGAHAVESFRFDDGASIGYRELVLNTFIVQGDTGDDLLTGTRIQDRLYGFEGDDELHAGDGNDTLTGGTGDDLLAGGDGGDRYVFHRGDGNDVLADSGDNYDGNFLAFDSDIDPAAISFTQDGDDMIVTYADTDSVRILDWNPERPSIREIRVGDLVTTVAALQNLQPYARGALEDQTALEDAAFSYRLPADAFADPEAGGLAYYADLADDGDAGNALPAWLAFDPATRTLYGTPENADVGGLDIRITATDPFGEAASQTLHLAVANVNDAPALAAPLADAVAAEDEPFSVTLPAGTFADVDAGDVLALAVTLADGDPLPAWLSFDAATRSLSGTPANADVGTLELRATATDLAGESAGDTFSLVVANANDAPVAAVPIADQFASEDAPFALNLAGTFADADADDALFTFASLANGDPLPAWLAYDPDTRSFSGTPLNEDVGAFDVTLSAVDAAGAPVSQTFGVAVANTNDAPETGFAELEALLAEDNGLPAEAPLAAQGVIQFTDADLGDAHEVQTSALGASYAGTFGAQLVADSTGASAADAGSAGSVQWTFSVANGALDALGEGVTGEQSYEVRVDDGHGGVAPSIVKVTLAGVNDAPALAAPIADQEAQAGTAFSFTFAANSFTDVDAGDALTYGATLADGSALPSWLGFDAATRTFAGTPPASTTPQSLEILVAASDASNASASDSFVLDIAASPGDGIAPIVGTDHDDVLDGTSGDDVIVGLKGYDRMSGGAGDDVYYVDKTGSRVDLVIEAAASGYDTVYSDADYTLGANVEELHLIGDHDLEGHGNALANMLIGNAGDSELYGEAGNDLLLDDAGEDRLDGGAGDDVLDGGAGDDMLTGGAGDDLFVHAARGGDDVVRDSGGTDAIRFGEGIAQADVAVRRSGNDLQLHLAGGNGSVTVKDWFSSASGRVEQVQFADGTTWNEAAIRARVTTSGGHGGGRDQERGAAGAGAGDYGGSGRHDDGGHDGHGNDGRGGRRGGHDDDRDGRGGGDMRDAVAARLNRDPNYDFTALAQYLQKNGGGYGAMTPAQIAGRWLQVQNRVASLAQMDGHDGSDGHGGGHHDGGGWGGDDGRWSRGWGYSGSTGQHGAWGGMDRFSGLGEGFRRL